MDNNSFNFNIPKHNMVIPDPTKRLRKVLNETNALIEEKERKKEQHDAEVLQALKNIEKSVGDISTLVAMVQSNNEYQVEIIEIWKQIAELSGAQNEEEANSRFRNIMNKANEINGDIETSTSLINYAKTVWLMVKSYFDNPQ